MMKTGGRRRSSLSGQYDYPTNGYATQQPQISQQQQQQHLQQQHAQQQHAQQQQPMGASDDAGVSFWSSYSVVESLFADDPTSVVSPGAPVSGGASYPSMMNGGTNRSSAPSGLKGKDSAASAGSMAPAAMTGMNGSSPYNSILSGGSASPTRTRNYARTTKPASNGHASYEGEYSSNVSGGRNYYAAVQGSLNGGGQGYSNPMPSTSPTNPGGIYNNAISWSDSIVSVRTPHSKGLGAIGSSGWGEIGSGPRAVPNSSAKTLANGNYDSNRSSFPSTSPTRGLGGFVSTSPTNDYSAYFSTPAHPLSLSTSSLPVSMHQKGLSGWENAPASIHQPKAHSQQGMGTYNAFSSGFVSPIGSPRSSKLDLASNKFHKAGQQQAGAAQGRYNVGPYSQNPLLLSALASVPEGSELGAGPLTLMTLPSSFLLRMMAFLGARDLAALQLVSSSQRIGDLSTDDRLWKDLYLKRWCLLETETGAIAGRARESGKNSSNSDDDGEDDSGDEWAWICSLLQQNNRWKDIYRTRYSADRWRVGTLKMFNGCWGFISQTPDPYSYTPVGSTQQQHIVGAGSGAMITGSSSLRGSNNTVSTAGPAGAPSGDNDAPLDIFFHRKDIASDGDWYEDWWLKDTPGVSRSQKCGYWDTFLCGRVVRYKQRAAYAQGRRPQACCISFVGDERRERLGTTPSAAVAAAVAAAASGGNPAIAIPGMMHHELMDSGGNISVDGHGNHHNTGGGGGGRRGGDGHHRDSHGSNNSRDSHPSSRERHRSNSSPQQLAAGGNNGNGNGNFMPSSPSRGHGPRGYGAH